MDKIAIISDIHNNITALNTVLEDIKKRGIKHIYCLGDMLVKCSSPYECVKTVLSNCEVVIKGNCEERTIEPRIQEHVWNKSKLSKEQIETIKDLPLSYDFYMSGYKVRLMHASPNSVHQKSYFWNFSDDFSDRMKLMFQNTEYLNNIGTEEPDIVVFGHIHRPLIIRLKNKTLINPGAVSNSSDIININGKDYTYGSYLIMEGILNSKDVSKISYKIVKFTYDHIEEANKIKETDMPNKDKAYSELMTGKYFNRAQLNKEGVIQNG